MTASFDPWTATFAEAQAAHGEGFDPSPAQPLYQWNAAQEVTQLREEVELGNGFAVLDAISRCARHGLVMPDWLARQYLTRYHGVLNCRVGSWDQAFGAPFPVRVRLATWRLRREKRWALWLFFTAQHAPPRNREGWRAAASALGVTPRQAEEWTPKTRKNSRGHKPYGWAREASAHDPFGMAPKRKKTG